PTDDATALLVVLDGAEYKQWGAICTIVDNLIADEKIRPISLAMIANAGDFRVHEYNQSETLPMLIDRQVLPLANKHLHLLDLDAYEGGYGILGASFGGLAALYTALRMPHVFGTVISQAGAFWSFNDKQDALIHVLLDSLPKQNLNIWMDVGIYDFLFEENQDMRRRLGERGYDVSYAEHFDGHNYTAWRDTLPTALETMFSQA
ncbi:MAG: alpha/beta hydrolase-fold protein, partial [Chloroflexota bacterium]